MNIHILFALETYRDSNTIFKLMLRAFSLDWVFHFLSYNDAVCVGLSEWKQNDSASSRKQIAFPSAHNMFLACLVEMRSKRTYKGSKVLRRHIKTPRT